MNSLPEASYFWLVLKEKMLIAFFSQEGSVLREPGESHNSHLILLKWESMIWKHG